MPLMVDSAIVHRTSATCLVSRFNSPSVNFVPSSRLLAIIEETFPPTQRESESVCVCVCVCVCV